MNHWLVLAFVLFCSIAWYWVGYRDGYRKGALYCADAIDKVLKAPVVRKTDA